MRRSKWAVGLLLCATPACATEAAVALLADVRNPTTTDAMLRNLATLALTCEWARRYDVIVFHEGGTALVKDYHVVAVCPLARPGERREVAQHGVGRGGVPDVRK